MSSSNALFRLSQAWSKLRHHPPRPRVVRARNVQACIVNNSLVSPDPKRGRHSVPYSEIEFDQRTDRVLSFKK